MQFRAHLGIIFLQELLDPKTICVWILDLPERLRHLLSNYRIS